MLKLGACFLLFFLGCTQAQFANSGMNRYFSLVTALKYGDQCGWAAEEARQNFTRFMYNNGAGNSFSLLMEALRFKNKVLAENIKFCAATELLTCDRETQKCVCGEPGLQVGVINATKEHFTVETDSRTGKKECKWLEGSFCFSQNIASMLGLPPGLFKGECQQGAECKDKEGRFCSRSSFDSYVMRLRASMGRGGRVPSLKSIMEDIYAGNLCSCAADQRANLVESDEWEWRRKRSVQDSDSASDEEDALHIMAPVSGFAAILQ